MLFTNLSRLLLGSSVTLLSLAALVGKTQPAKAIDIVFDYRYDETANGGNNFFNTQEKRDLLDDAALYFENAFDDTLDAINPTGSNTWSPRFTNPGTGEDNFADSALDNMMVQANEIIVFAGGHDIAGGAIGTGGPGGYTASGTQAWLDSIKSRGEPGVLEPNPTDFAPWGGSIFFDTATTWHFGDASTSVPSATNDFLSVAIHELGHLVGFGIADSWDTFVEEPSANNFVFTGDKSNEIYGGNVPLTPDSGHWQDGIESQVKGLTDPQETAMDPTLTVGERKFLTDLDYAGLQDIGWEVNSSAYSSSVPFEFSPSWGILVVAGMFGTKKVWNARKVKQSAVE